jgi:uncharacterized membrane protein YkoI
MVIMPGKTSVNRLFVILTLIATLVIADEGHREARRLTETGKILPLEDLMQSIQAEQPGRVLEVELERDDGRYLYEIEILDPQGAVWEFKLDATSGEIVERELED